MVVSTPSSESSWSASSAVLPPPTTSARSTPASVSVGSALSRSMNAVAPTTPGPSSPGTPSAESRAEAEAEEDGVVVAQQMGRRGDVPAAAGRSAHATTRARADLDAPLRQLEDPGDLVEGRVALHLVGRDAERVEAARDGPALEDRPIGARPARATPPPRSTRARRRSAPPSSPSRARAAKRPGSFASASCTA